MPLLSYARVMSEPFSCRVCGDLALDCPQRKDEVWETIAEKTDFLCLDHAEELLGRPINVSDLAPCPANEYAVRLHQQRQEKNAAPRIFDVDARHKGFKTALST